MEGVKERVAEEAYALTFFRDGVSRMLNEETEILGKVKMNNILAGKMCKAGIDAQANTIPNDLRFITMTSVISKPYSKLKNL